MTEKRIEVSMLGDIYLNDKELKQYESGGHKGNSYLKVVAVIDNEHIYAHRLVWLAFNGTIPKGMQINHKNGKKNNNHISNLELVTCSENIRHAYVSGLNPRKLSKEEIDRRAVKRNIRRWNESGSFTI